MRTAQVFSFVRRRAPPDWSPQDIAEFYRVEAILTQSGLQVTSARGVTDEGDPWFVFCRAEDDEVIIHFARIDGRYVISSPAYCGNAAGYDFRTLVRGVIERHPILRPKPSGENLFMHPAALLVMLVATAFLKSGHAAEAASVLPTTPSDAAIDTKSRTAPPSGMLTATPSVTLDATQETLLLSAINAAIVASAPQHAVTEATTPAPYFVPDVADHPQSPSLNAMDRPHEAQMVGSSDMTPTYPPSSAIASPVDPVANGPMHLLPPNDTIALKLISPEALHFPSPPDSPSPPPQITTTIVAPDAVANVQHVSLSGLSDIPHADKVLLQALGVPDVVAYTPTPPAAISTVIQSGVHTTAANAVADSAVADDVFAPAEPITHAAPAPAATTAPPATPAATMAIIVPDQIAQPSVTTDPDSTVLHGATVAHSTLLDYATVMHIVLAFEAVEAQPTVLANDHGVIFYDAAAINSHYSAVKSVTYDFGDGFSISLVGLPVELTHAGAHV